MPVAYLAIVPQECGISYISTAPVLHLQNRKKPPSRHCDEKGGSVLR